MHLWIGAALTLSAGVSAATTSNETCTSALDCQLNGVCDGGACACYPAWTGANCAVLNLLPAAVGDGYGYLGSNTSSWGAGVVFDPTSNSYVMFNDEMNNHCGLQTWGHNSRCVLSVSETPAGPFTRLQVVVESWCHGSSIARDPLSGRFVLQHMASGGGPVSSCTQCADGVTPAGAPSAPCDGPPGVAPYSTAAYVADAADGPYVPAPAFLNGANCETAFAPNGTVYVACPWGGKGPDPVACPQAAFLTVSTAASLDAGLAGNWTHLPMTYSLAGSNATDIW
jgi:hypothetical protein